MRACHEFSPRADTDTQGIPDAHMFLHAAEAGAVEPAIEGGANDGGGGSGGDVEMGDEGGGGAASSRSVAGGSGAGAGPDGMEQE